MDADPSTLPIDPGPNRVVRFVVDNFPPILKKVEGTAGGRLVAYGEWVPVVGGSPRAFAFTTTKAGTPKDSVRSPLPVVMTFTFSEPVGNVEASLVNDDDGTQLPILSLAPSSGVPPDDTWTGTIAVDATLNGGNHFHVTATDTAGHVLDTLGDSETTGAVQGFVNGDTGSCVACQPGQDEHHTLSVNIVSKGSVPGEALPGTAFTPPGFRFGHLDLNLDISLKADLDYLKTFSGINLRFRGYVPWHLVFPKIPSGMHDMFSGILSGRGIDTNLCGVSTDKDPKIVKDDLRNRLNDISAQRAAMGLSGHVTALRAKLMAFGDQTTPVNDLLTDPAESVGGFVGHLLYNNSPLGDPGLQQVLRDGEDLMIAFENLSEAYSIIDAYLAVVSGLDGEFWAIPDELFSSATYLLEHSEDVLKCEAYTYADQVSSSASGLFNKLPGGSQYKGLVLNALGNGTTCLLGERPQDCGILDGYLTLRALYHDTEDRVNRLRSLPAHIRSVSILQSDDTTSNNKNFTMDSAAVATHQVLTALQLATPFIDHLFQFLAFYDALTETGKGNFSALLGAQSGVASGLISRFTGSGGVVHQQTLGTGDRISSLGDAAAGLPLLGSSGDAFGSFAYRGAAHQAGGQIMELLDPPPVLTITHPADGGVIGYNTNRAILTLEGHVSDYLPHLVKISAQADDGQVFEAALDLDTITTDEDGSTGNAFFRIKMPLPHGGLHLVKVTAANAAGHEVSQTLHVYVDGTQFPHRDSVARATTSYTWRATGAQSTFGTGRLTYLAAAPGELPSDLVTVPATVAGNILKAFTSDNQPHPDVAFVDPATGLEIGSVPFPAFGSPTTSFLVQLRPHYQGAMFLTMIGNGDSLGFQKARLEFRGLEGPDQPGAGDFIDPGHTIAEFTTPVPGAIVRRMAEWKTSPLELAGRYALRMRMTDNHLPPLAGGAPFAYTKGPFRPSATIYQEHLAGFSGLQEVDQEAFFLGVPIDPAETNPTIVSDPYDKLEVQFSGGASNPDAGIRYVNVYSIGGPPASPLSSEMQTIGPLWDVMPRLGVGDFAQNQGARLTVHYAHRDLDLNLGLFGTSIGDVVHREAILEENLGLYEEITSHSETLGAVANTPTGVRAVGDRVLITTELQPGGFTFFAETNDLTSRFLALPANSAPLLSPPPFSSPLIFSPELASSGRPLAHVFVSVKTGASPRVFVDAEVLDASSGRRVAVLAQGIEQGVSATLAYIGDSATADEDSRIDPVTGVVDTTGFQKRYFFVAATPIALAWDGRGEREDGSIGYVGDGLYTVRLRVMDIAGNIARADVVVIKGKFPPHISALGNHPATGTPLLDASVDGQAIAIVGTASNPAGFSGYRIAIRPLSVTYFAPSDYLPLPTTPLQYFGADPTTAVIQVTGDRLADLPVGSLKDGMYEVGVFLVDATGGVIDQDTARFQIANPAGFYNFTASPTPFGATTQLSVARSDSTAIHIDVTATCSGVPITPVVLTAVKDSDPSAVWRATFDPAALGLPGDCTYHAQAFSTAPVLASTTCQVDAAYVVSNGFLTAQISAPSGGSIVSGQVEIDGTATAGIPEALNGYTLSYWTNTNPTPVVLVTARRSVVASALGALDVSVLDASTVTVTLSVTGQSGQVNAQSVTWTIPYSARLAVSPVQILPGDPLKGVSAMTYGVSRASTNVLMEIVDGCNAVISTLASSPTFAAGSAAAAWDGTDTGGAVVPAGAYTARLTAISGLSTTQLLVSLTVLGAAGSTVTSSFDSAELDGTPTPYFEMPVTGAGAYDAPYLVRPRAMATGTEQWVNHPGVLRYAGGAPLGDCINIFGPLGARTVDECEGGDGGIPCGTAQSCLDALYVAPFNLIASVSVFTGCGGCSAPENEGPADAVYGISGLFSQYVIETGCGGKGELIDTKYNQTLTLHACATGDGCHHGTSHVQGNIVAPGFTPFCVQYTALPSIGMLSPQLLYAHRAISRPFELRMTPDHTLHFDSFSQPHAPGQCIGGVVCQHVDEPQEGTVFRVNPPAGMNSATLTAPTFGFGGVGGFSAVATGLAEVAIKNNYTDLVTLDGFTSHAWGSIDRLLTGTVTTRLTPGSLSALEFLWTLSGSFDESKPVNILFPFMNVTSPGSNVQVKDSFVLDRTEPLFWQSSGGSGAVSITGPGMALTGMSGTFLAQSGAEYTVAVQSPAAAGIDVGVVTEPGAIGPLATPYAPSLGGAQIKLSTSTTTGTRFVFSIQGFPEAPVPIPLTLTIAGNAYLTISGTTFQGALVTTTFTHSIHTYVQLKPGRYRIKAARTTSGSVHATLATYGALATVRYGLAVAGPGSATVSLDPHQLLVYWARTGSSLFRVIRSTGSTLFDSSGSGGAPEGSFFGFPGNYTVVVTGSGQVNLAYGRDFPVSITRTHLAFQNSGLAVASPTPSTFHAFAIPQPLFGGTIGNINLVPPVPPASYAETAAVSTTLLSAAVSATGIEATIAAQLILDKRRWSITGDTMRDNLVKWNKPNRVNIFERLQELHPQAQRPFPSDAGSFFAGEGPATTPHTSTWYIGGIVYPQTATPDPDIVIATVDAAFGSSIFTDATPFAVQTDHLTSPSLNYQEGYGGGESYQQQLADQVITRLRDPSPVPYAAHVFVKITGTAKFLPGGSYTLEAKLGSGGSSAPLVPIKTSTVSIESGILGYWDVTGLQPGAYTLVLTVVDASGNAKVMSIPAKVGHRISDKGGFATDAYEEVFLQFAPGALTAGNEKLISIRQLDPLAVPLFANNQVPVGLIFDFHAAAGSVETGLSKNDFVQDAGHNVILPASLMVHYDPRQLPSGIPEGLMNLFRLSRSGGVEHVEVVGALVDTTNKLILSEISEFSTYEVMPDPTPPRFKIQAAPDPSGVGDVRIFLESTKTLSGPPVLTVTPPAPRVAGTLSGVAPVLVPMLNGTIAVVGEPALYSALHLERVTVASGTTVVPSAEAWPGTPITIGTMHFLVEQVILEPSPTGDRTHVLLQTLSGAEVTDGRAAGIQPGMTWAAVFPTLGIVTGTIVGIGDVTQVQTSPLTLRQFSPGEPLNLPPAGWFTNRKIVIGTSTYFIDDARINGNSVVGGSFQVVVRDGSGQIVVDPAHSGFSVGQAWTIFRPSNTFVATYTVDPAHPVGTVFIDAVGADLLGTKGQGQGSFYVDPGLTALKIRVAPARVSPGEGIDLFVSAGALIGKPTVAVKFPGLPTTTSVELIADVVPGTREASGSFFATIGVPTNSISGTSTVFVTATIGALVKTVSATFVVDAGAPRLTLTVHPNPVGLGPLVVDVASSEPLDALTGSLTDRFGVHLPVEFSATAALDGQSQFEATVFLGSGSLADGPALLHLLGADRVGNTGAVDAIVQVDLTPPPPVSNLFTRVVTHSVIRLDWVSPSSTDVEGILVSRDDIPLTGTGLVPSTALFVDQGLVYGQKYSYQVVTRDRVGNQSVMARADRWLDVDPPTTTLVFGAHMVTATPIAVGDLALFVSPSTTLGFSASDTGSGIVTETDFREGTTGRLLPFTETFTGAVLNLRHLLSWQSVDIAGNSERIRSATIIVDSRPPVLAFTIGQPSYVGPSQPQAPMSLPPATATLTEADFVFSATSQGIPLPLDGLLSATSFDPALIAQGAGIAVLNIGINGVFIGPSTQVSYGYGDGFEGSGFDHAFYRIDDEPIQPFPAAITPGLGRAEGTYTIKIFGCDRVGNCSDETNFGRGRQLRFTIDLTPPGLATAFFNPQPLASADGHTYVFDDTDITMTATDSGGDQGKIPSGVRFFDWRVDDEVGFRRVPADAIVHLAEHAYGEHVLHIRAVDGVGNAGPERDYGPYFITTHDWPRYSFSNARTSAPEFEPVSPPYRLDWSASTTANNTGGPVLVAHGRVYTETQLPQPVIRGPGVVTCISARNFLLHARDVDTGTILWSRTVVGHIGIRGMTYEHERLVITGFGLLECPCSCVTFSDRLQGYRADTGAFAWTLTLGGGIKLSPPMAAGQSAIGASTGELAYVVRQRFLGPGGSDALAVEMTTGQVRWTETLFADAVDEHFTSRGAPSVRDHLVVVGTKNGVMALDAMTGVEKWRNADFACTRVPTIGEDLIVVPALSGTTTGILALNLADGGFRWFSRIISSPPSLGVQIHSASAIDSARRVYTFVRVSSHTLIYVLDGTDGHFLWAAPADSTEAPPIVHGDVYVTDILNNGDRRPAVLRQATVSSTFGVEVWRGTDSNTGSPLMVARHRLFAFRSTTNLAGTVAYSNNTPVAFRITVMPPLVAGVTFSQTVTAMDLTGRQVLSYLGTVTFTSTDQFANLPAATSLTGANGGLRRFATSTVYVTGTTTITVTDTGGLAGSVTVTVLPHPPVDVVAEGGAERTTVNWNLPALPLDTVVGYRLFRATGAAGPFAFIAAPSGRSATLYVDLGVADFATYYYRVTAVESHGLESPPSLVAPVTVFPGPQTPTLLVATGVSGGVSLGWTIANDGSFPVSGYDVFRKSGDSPFMPIARLSGASTIAFVDDTVEEGASYAYIVRARDDHGQWSEPSNGSSAAALVETNWRHIQREVSHQGNAKSEVFYFQPTRKWGTTAGAYIAGAIMGTHLYRQTAGGVVQAVDLASGTSLWQRSIGNVVAPPVTLWPAIQNDLVFVTNGSSLMALDGVGNVSTGTTTAVWSVTLTPPTGVGPGSATPTAAPRVGPTVGGGVVYIGMGGHVFAVEIATHRVLWSATLAGTAAADRIFPPIVSGESVIFLTERGLFYAFGTGDYDLRTRWGSLHAQMNLGVTGLTAAPSLAGANVIIPAGSHLMAIRASDGMGVWSISQPGVTFPAEVAIANGRIYAVGGTDGALRVYAADTGALQSTADVTLPGQYTAAKSFSAPAVADTRLFYTASLLPVGKTQYEGHLVGFELGSVGGTPALTYVSSENVAETNAAPSISQLNIVTGNTAFGIKQAVRLVIEVPANAAVNEPITMVIRALTVDGAQDLHFIGTIALTYSDPQAQMPPFVSITSGGGTFGGRLFKTGTVTISGFVVDRPGINGSTTLSVHPSTGQASQLVVQAPASAPPAIGFSVTVTAEDQFNNVISNFGGTVAFTSSDPLGRFPVPYAFSKTDAGIHRFSATLFTGGPQVITARDTSTATGPQGQATVNVFVPFVNSPADVVATCGLAGTVMLTWSPQGASLPLSGYFIYRSVAGGGLTLASFVRDGASTAYTDVIADEFVQHDYGVQAEDIAGHVSATSMIAGCVVNAPADWPMSSYWGARRAFSPIATPQPPLELKWKQYGSEGGVIFGTGGAAVAGGRMYQVMGQYFQQLDFASGEVLHFSRFEDSGGLEVEGTNFTGPAVFGNTVVIGVVNVNFVFPQILHSPWAIRGYDTETLALNWTSHDRFGSQVAIGGYSQIAGSGGLVYAGQNNILAAFSLTDGLLAWTKTLGTTGGTPVIDNNTVVGGPITGNGRVYATFGNGRLFSLDAVTGTLQWSRTIGTDPFGHTFQPALVGGQVVVGSSVGILIFDGTSGVETSRVLLAVPDPDARPLAYSPVIDGQNHMYFFSGGAAGSGIPDRLHAYDLTAALTGGGATPLWERDDLTASHLSGANGLIAAFQSDTQVADGLGGMVLVSTADGSTVQKLDRVPSNFERSRFPNAPPAMVGTSIGVSGVDIGRLGFGPGVLPVTDLAAVGGVGTIDLGWSKPVDQTFPVSQFWIFRSDVPGGFTLGTRIATVTTTYFTDTADTGLVPGPTFYYVVRAEDAVGNLSVPSNIASATDPMLVAISSPGDDASVEGRVNVRGTVSGRRLGLWRLQAAVVGSTMWATIAGSSSQVVDSMLGTWDATHVLHGKYVVRLTATGTGGEVVTREVHVVVGAGSPRALIASPGRGETVRGVVVVSGTAWAAPFGSYALGFATIPPLAAISPIGVSDQPVLGGDLGLWDTSNLPSGPYRLRLVVGDSAGLATEVSTTVFVDGQMDALLITASAEPAAFQVDQGGTTLRYRLRLPATVRIAVVEEGSNRRVWMTDDAAPGGPGHSPGWHEIAWDGHNEQGVSVAPGKYDALFMASDGVRTESRLVHLQALGNETLVGGSGPVRLSGAGSPGGQSVVAAGSANAGGGPQSAASGGGNGGSSVSGGGSPSGDSHDNGWHNGNNPNDFVINHDDKSNGNGNNHH